MAKIEKKTGKSGSRTKLKRAEKKPESGTRKSHTFHIFLGHQNGKNYWTSYEKEATLRELGHTILNNKPAAKLFTPAVVLNRFRESVIAIGSQISKKTIVNAYPNLECTTGWYHIDIDQSGIYTHMVKHTLFSKVKELKIVWVSHSGNGVKAIGYNERLKNLSPEDYKKTYREVCADIRIQSGLLKLNFDWACGRCHQLCFLNNDATALIRQR